jgi:hypothetical protein
LPFPIPPVHVLKVEKEKFFPKFYEKNVVEELDFCYEQHLVTRQKIRDDQKSKSFLGR